MCAVVVVTGVSSQICGATHLPSFDGGVPVPGRPPLLQQQPGASSEVINHL